MTESKEEKANSQTPSKQEGGIHLLGIRHHGPGSARAVRTALESIQPDIILLEGPPEADALLQWAAHTEMKPPVALLCYVPDNPKQSVFYPFAEFSPEWQAIRFAQEHKIPIRFFDLPIAHSLALKIDEAAETAQQSASPNTPPAVEEPLPPSADGQESPNSNNEPEEPITVIKRDPISYLAEAAGYEDGELWWEQMFEYRRNAEGVFEAVGEAMTSLREHLPAKDDRREALREAHMRKMIRQAEKELYTTMAVVCGAWHVPALTGKHSAKHDNELLKGLPKAKVECTWIPWTYNRLSYWSGYGAGINSPGWYHHLWHHPHDDGTRWMGSVAKLFRQKGMDTSVAHLIEAVRLAEGLASLRGLHKAGLEELNEATLSVLCNGEPLMMQLLHDELIVSHTIGQVPTEIPKPPLQVDIEKAQKSLRLPATADFKDYTLDLRNPNDLARSVLLHRLRLLGIEWGRPSEVAGKGTFKEGWRVQWEPEFSVAIIEKGTWGNTVEEAANNYLIAQAAEATSLPAVTGYLQGALPAELHRAVEALVVRINNLSAASGDVLQLMEALPPLVTTVRYGNVRATGADKVLPIVESMMARISIGLPNAAAGLADEAAGAVVELMTRMQESVALLQMEFLTTQWQQALNVTASGTATAPVVSGYATRLLRDAKAMEEDALVTAFHFRLSRATPPDVSAAWLEGFLRGSGTVLLLDESLWALVNSWVAGLPPDVFTAVLPLLRRTFAAFTPPERRKLGEKAKSGGTGMPAGFLLQTDYDAERGEKGLPVVLQLLGLQRVRAIDA